MDKAEYAPHFQREQPRGVQNRRKKVIFGRSKDVSFEIEEGNTIGLIGAKRGGKVHSAENHISDYSSHKRRVRIKGRIGSLLEVGTGFHPELTGRDNVFLNGAILGMSRAEVKSKFADIVALCGVRTVHRYTGEALFEWHVRAPSLRGLGIS